MKPIPRKEHWIQWWVLKTFEHHKDRTLLQMTNGLMQGAPKIRPAYYYKKEKK